MLTTVKDAAAARRSVIAIAKERGVRWVRLAFVDVLGIQKSVSIPVNELDDAFRPVLPGGRYLDPAAAAEAAEAVKNQGR